MSSYEYPQSLGSMNEQQQLYLPVHYILQFYKNIYGRKNNVYLSLETEVTRKFSSQSMDAPLKMLTNFFKIYCEARVIKNK